MLDASEEPEDMSSTSNLAVVAMEGERESGRDGERELEMACLEDCFDDGLEGVGVGLEGLRDGLEDGRDCVLDAGCENIFERNFIPEPEGTLCGALDFLSLSR